MFEVGHKIRVKSNASRIKHPFVGFPSGMYQYQGREAIIKKVSKSAVSGTRIYNLDIAGTYWFVDEWLEPIEQINDTSANEICKILED